jgi:hypothetical protein
MASVTPNALTVTMAVKFAIRLVRQALFHAEMFSASQALMVPLSQPQQLMLSRQLMLQLVQANNSQ